MACVTAEQLRKVYLSVHQDAGRGKVSPPFDGLFNREVLINSLLSFFPGRRALSN
jgi:hypothetical protein